MSSPSRQRHCLTEEEHDKLAEIGDSFWLALGKLAAKHILQMPAELEDLTTAHLQDKCSIYGTRYGEIIDKARRKK